MTEKRVFTFEDVEIHAEGRFVRLGGHDVYIRQQSLAMLLYLVEHRDRLVPKEELYRAVWKDVAVGDDAIAQCIADIRRVLHDDSRAPRFVKTVPKLGYRFVAAVVESSERAAAQTTAKPEAAIGATPPPTKPPRRLRWSVLTGLVVLIGAPAWVYVANRGVLPPVGAAGTRRVIVGYFANQSADRELAWLGRGLPEMITTELARFDRLSVLGQGQVDTLLSRAGVTPERAMTPAEITDVASRGRADIVVTGAFATAGGAIRVDVTAVDPRNGRTLGADSVVAARPDEVLSQVNVLALKLASRLGVRATPPASADLVSISTPSLEAYRLYTLGVERSNAYQTDLAINLLQQAVALDPEFAMGYARIGYARLFSAGDPDGARPFLEKAFQISSRLNDHDRAAIAAWYAVSHRDYDDAIRRFRALVARYPDDTEALWRLGYILVGENRLEEAVQVLETGLAFDPDSKELTNTLGGAYLKLGRKAEAVALALRYVALAPAEPNAHDSLAMTYQWAGRYEESLAEYERALSLNPGFEIARIHLGNLYYQLGRYRDAVAEYGRYKPARTQAGDPRAIVCIAWTRAAMGQFGEAMKQARVAAARTKWFSPDLVLVAVASGDLRQAESWMRLPVASWTERGARLTRRADEVAYGAVALRQGRSEEAIAHMKKALSYTPTLWLQTGHEDALADTYRQLGRLDEAAAEYERVLELNPRLPMALYRYAEVLDRQGKPAEARSMLERFLKVWDHADLDAPARLDAERRLAGRR